MGQTISDHVLRDARGLTIGRISTDGNGVQTLRDALGIKKGTYDPKMNKTRDAQGLLVGTGNLLASLL